MARLFQGQGDVEAHCRSLGSRWWREQSVSSRDHTSADADLQSREISKPQGNHGTPSLPLSLVFRQISRNHLRRCTRHGRCNTSEPNSLNGGAINGKPLQHTLPPVNQLMDLSRKYLTSSTISVTDIRATLPYTAWPHRVDIGREVPRGEHHFSSGQPLFDLSSGSFPTGLLQDPEIDLPAVDFKPKSELDARIQARCEYHVSFDRSLIL